MSDGKSPIAELIRAAERLEYGFGDAVVVSGLNARQLRNGLDRGVLKVGRKLESVDRWVFSARDCLQLMVIGDLTSRAWVPIGQAAEVARLLVQSFDFWLPKFSDSMATAQSQKSVSTVYEVIAFPEDGETRVIIHRRGDDEWGFYDLDGSALDHKNWLDAHVRLPVLGMISRYLAGMSMVLSERSKAN